MEEVEGRLTQRQKHGIKLLLFSQRTALNSLIRLLSRAPSTDTQDVAEEYLSTHILRQLRNVEKALKNVDSENFGICEICYKLIPFERLMAMPTAAHCVQCAAVDDRRQRLIVLKRTPPPRSLILSF